MSFIYSLSDFVFVIVSVLYFCFNLVRGFDNEFTENMKQTRLIAKVLWKVSGDGKEKKPAPMNTMQKGATLTSNLTSLIKRYVTFKIIT